MVFERFFDAQRNGDEGIINNMKEQYKQEIRALPDAALIQELHELGPPMIDSAKSALKWIWFTPDIGASMHSHNLRQEAKRRAIQETLNERAYYYGRH